MRLTPKVQHTAALLVPEFNASVIAAHFSLLVVTGRPLRLPLLSRFKIYV
jgi:hypothetical protein